jgi:hypothetical protein
MWCDLLVGLGDRPWLQVVIRDVMWPTCWRQALATSCDQRCHVTYLLETGPGYKLWSGMWGDLLVGDRPWLQVVIRDAMRPTCWRQALVTSRDQGCDVTYLLKTDPGNKLWSGRSRDLLVVTGPGYKLWSDCEATYLLETGPGYKSWSVCDVTYLLETGPGYKLWSACDVNYLFGDRSCWQVAIRDVTSRDLIVWRRALELWVYISIYFAHNVHTH